MTITEFNFSPNGRHSRESGNPEFITYVETIAIISLGDLRYLNNPTQKFGHKIY